jgi:enoyl-CoA hydratase/carnithine racemase/predicted GIY-YIG superfamily endonuclease
VKTYYVYIMASYRRVLYTGVTSKAQKRVWEHKNDVHRNSFSAKYRCHSLVYLEPFVGIVNAIKREKVIKHMTRAEKIALIEKENPRWHDLSAEWQQPAQVLRAPVGRAKDDIVAGMGFRVETNFGCRVIHLTSTDHTNRLSSAVIRSLTNALHQLWREPTPLLITGNAHFFSAGADLNEIAALTGPAACEFAQMGQRLMRLVDDFPAPVVAAISGYCMGGGLDLALACDRRIAAQHAIFGHRGAALGLMTGWGGTQRLPRLVGKGRALQMFLAAEKLHAADALRIGLVDEIADDPIAAAQRCVARMETVI